MCLAALTRILHALNELCFGPGGRIRMHESLPLKMVIPFAGMLLSIALLPLVAPGIPVLASAVVAVVAGLWPRRDT